MRIRNEENKIPRLDSVSLYVPYRDSLALFHCCFDSIYSIIVSITKRLQATFVTVVSASFKMEISVCIAQCIDTDSGICLPTKVED